MAEIVMIPVTQIHPHPKNPRKNIGDVTELANSIKAKGVLQNLTVVPGHWMTQEEWTELSAQYKENPTEEVRDLMNSKWLDTGYTAIIGHRRLAASKQAGLPEVPCVVVNLTDREQFDTMMVENVQRADLTIIEQAQGFQMMLDMGGTVESVSEQTGFSQTTVRNRLKLMKLDQQKLQQSMEREATLNDYMELDKIEDPKLRNKVLESIGTPNFRSELASALTTEKTNRKMAAWIALVSPFAEKIEKQDTKTMEYIRVFSRYNDPTENGWEPPADIETTKYFYRVENSYGVYLYREKTVDVDEEERKKREQAAKQAEFDRKKNEFEEISDRHYALRNSFLMEFSASKKCCTSIVMFALQTIVRTAPGYGYKIDWQLVADMLDIRMDDDQKKVDPVEYAAAIKENPEYSLLVTAYCALAQDGDKYWDWNWSGSERSFKHEENDKLDLIYQMLTQLGYEMSDEEIAMQKGTHELFSNSSDEADSEEDDIDENDLDYDDLEDADFVEEDED